MARLPTNVTANTSPVYVVVGAVGQRSPSDATYMMALTDGGREYVDPVSIAADAERQVRVRRHLLTEGRGHTQ